MCLRAILCNHILECNNEIVNGREFIRRARRYARRTGQNCHFDQRQGKGSHGMLYLGDRQTVVKHGEISRGMLTAMLRQLGIDREDF